ncbi:MAG TPA: methionyl-tRNA formyltransferase [Opitutaceae bacterium]|nr:methionyl-tRNA formyltransferase [Opitutaceae bacterium]
MSAPLKVVFLGSDPIARPLLDWMSGEGGALARVIAVFTQPDRPAGRGQGVRPNEIKTWALGRGLPVFQPEKLTEDVRAQLAALQADVALVMAYGHILRDDFIATPRLGSLNLHASILPRYRGASPIQAAIAAGERETGVTLMRIVRRLDAGPVADAERVPIGPLETAADIEGRLAAACVPLLARAWPRLADGSLSFVPQDETAASYCRRLVKEDGFLDFRAPAAVLAARINGLFPWPSCAIAVEGAAVRVGLADALPAGAPKSEGTILGADEAGLLVATGTGVLRMRRLQRAGGRMLEAGEFLRGFPLAPGTKLESRPMPELVSTSPAKK